MTDAFRESLVRRSARQTITLAKAVRAGRRRRKTTTPPLPRVDGPPLCDLLTETGADARLVHVTINRPRWTGTDVHASAGDQVTWVGWGYAHVIKPLAIGAWPRFALAGRIRDGTVQQSGRDTYTFTADRNGEVELA